MLYEQGQNLISTTVSLRVLRIPRVELISWIRLLRSADASFTSTKYIRTVLKSLAMMLAVALSGSAMTLPVCHFGPKVSILGATLERRLLKLESLAAEYGILASIMLGNDFCSHVTIVRCASRVQLAMIPKYIKNHVETILHQCTLSKMYC